MLALRRRVIGFSPYLEISPTTISFSWNGSETKTVTVTSNTTWEVQTTAE